MPVDAPYYQSPPFYYRNARAVIVTYATDTTAAAAMLPEGLELAPSPLPDGSPLAVLMLVRYPASTLGPYREAILGIPCLWASAPYLYVPHIAVDSAPALVAGREVWGFPKEMARIDLARDQDLISGSVERPSGVRLVTATMRSETPLDPAEQPQLAGTISLRVIPSPEEGKPPSLAELVSVPSTDTRIREMWQGPATLAFDAESSFDPWYRLPIRTLLSGIYQRWDFTMPHGKVIKSY
jgi:acetoacetate decarboxylase